MSPLNNHTTAYVSFHFIISRANVKLQWLEKPLFERYIKL